MPLRDRPVAHPDKEDGEVDLDLMEACRAGQHASDDVVEMHRRSQQQAALDRSAGDLDHRPAEGEHVA